MLGIIGIIIFIILLIISKNLIKNSVNNLSVENKAKLLDLKIRCSLKSTYFIVLAIGFIILAAYSNHNILLSTVFIILIIIFMFFEAYFKLKKIKSFPSSFITLYSIGTYLTTTGILIFIIFFLI